MNPSSGEFIDVDRAENWMQRIYVGEVIKIKGEECEVVTIGRREITLKLLSTTDREEALADYAENAMKESARQLQELLKRQK
jgi:hypothetical protein